MKIYKFILGVAMLGTVAGCTGSFEEYNTNPYEPLDLARVGVFPAMIDCLASPEGEPLPAQQHLLGLLRRIRYGSAFVEPLDALLHLQRR